MKALSLWQPWATLVAIGQKRVETRSWRTSYRGPLLICSTQKVPGDVFRKTTTDPRFYERVRCSPIGYEHGVALCVVDLEACVPSEEWIDGAKEAEQWDAVQCESMLGDLSPGRFAWTLRRPRPLWRKNEHGMLLKMIDVKGRQGLWTVPLDLLVRVKESLALAEVSL